MGRRSSAWVEGARRTLLTEVLGFSYTIIIYSNLFGSLLKYSNFYKRISYFSEYLQVACRSFIIGLNKLKSSNQMEQPADILCKLCLTHCYEGNPVHTIPSCKHTLCESCLNELLSGYKSVPFNFRCPFDQVQYTFYSKDFSNPSYMLLKQKPSPSGVSLAQKSILIESCSSEPFCRTHQQLKELWCVRDRMLVCPKCALFEHAEHKIQEIDVKNSTKYSCSKELLGLLEGKEGVFAKINGDAIKREAKKEFENKRKAVLKDLKKWFMCVFEMLAEAEKTCYEKVDKCFKRLEQKFIYRLNIRKEEAKELELWEEMALLKLESYRNGDQVLANTKQQLLAVLGQHMAIVNEGEQILCKLKHHIQSINESKNRINQCVTITDDGKLKSLLRDLPQNLVKQSQSSVSVNDVYETVRQRTKTLQQSVSRIELPLNDELLLEEQIKFQPAPTNSFLRETVSFTTHLCQSAQHQETLQLTKSPSISSFYGNKSMLDMSLKSLKGGLTKSQSMTSLATTTKRPVQPSSRPTMLKQVQIDRHPLKKLAQTNLPDKFKKLIEQINQNRITVLDLGCCELDILAIAHILQLIVSKPKIRTVKLIKCKLSDQLIEQLWRYFPTIVTLNLSQNYLTEKTVDSLMLNRQIMPNLRSVVLSQNSGIKERALKHKLEELAKMGLSVTV